MSKTIDPITLQVIGGALHAIAEQMGNVRYRMSYSSIIRESQDLGAGLFDLDYNTLCESDSTPMHIGSLPWYIRGFLTRLDGKIVEGDVIVHNDPYRGGMHTPEHTFLKPIFRDGTLAGFAGAIGHIGEISAP